jgi:hypothetical protein
MKHTKSCFLLAFFFGLSISVSADEQKTSSEPPPDKSEWIIAPGYTLVEEPAEFEAPVSMAFIHNNSGKPGDIKYFVTELRGKIFAVTNDGQKILVKEVEEIAKPNGGELPYSDGEIGLNGICLSHDDKFLFTTGVIQSGYSIHNSVSRWEPANGKAKDFNSISTWKDPQRTAYLKDIFLNDRTAKSHNIGHCLTTSDNILVFGTGDGSTPERTHMIDSTNGKLFRTHFDFSGVKSNPFFNPAKPKDPKSLFYAMGLRNPFAITMTQNEFFIADNGPGIDRLIHVEKGKDYPWTGSDTSMTYDNMLSFTTTIGPSGIIFVPWNHKFESLRGHLLIAASLRRQIIDVPLTPNYKIASDWQAIVKPVEAEIRGYFSGFFMNGDDLYIPHIRVRQKPESGIIPSKILKLVATTQVQGPVKLTGEALMHAKDCRACHVYIGRGGQQGPGLDDVVQRLKGFLSDKDYLKKLEELQGFTDEVDHQKWKAVRDDLINEKGSLDERVAKFIAAKIEHPQFNNATNVMPKLGLTQDEIAEMVRYLTITSREPAAGTSWKQKLKQKLKSDPTPAAVLVLILGALIGFVIGRRKRKI